MMQLCSNVTDMQRCTETPLHISEKKILISTWWLLIQKSKEITFEVFSNHLFYYFYGLIPTTLAFMSSPDFTSTPDAFQKCRNFSLDCWKCADRRTEGPTHRSCVCGSRRQRTPIDACHLTGRVTESWLWSITCLGSRLTDMMTLTLDWDH